MKSWKMTPIWARRSSTAKSLRSMPSTSDAALVGIVEPGQQLDDGGLAGAVLADQRQRLAGLQREVQVAHRPALGVGIAEADILEDDALADRLRERLRVGRQRDGRLDVEEGEQVVEIERLAGDLGEADQDLLRTGR